MSDDDNQLPDSAADDTDTYGLDSPVAGTGSEGRWGEQRDSAGGGGGSSKAASKGSEWALYGHAQSHATTPLARPATAQPRRSLGLGSDASVHPGTPTPPRRPRTSAPHAPHVAWAVDSSGSPLHDGRPGSSGGGSGRGAGLSSAARSRLAAAEADSPSTVAHILASLRKPCPCPGRPGKEVERLEDDLRLARQALTAANEQNKRLATERNRLEQQLGSARANLLKAEELLGVRERVLSPNAGLSRLYRNPDTTALVAGLREQVTALSADRQRLRGQVEQLAKSARATRVADLQAEVAAQAQELARQSKMLRVMRQRMEEAEAVAAQVVNAMANHVSSRRTALAAATGGDSAVPNAAAGRSAGGAASAASALRPPDTLPSDNPLSREQVKSTLAVLAQAHGALSSQAALLAEVFPPGLSMEQLGAKAALRAATAGAPDVLRYLRHHVLSLVDTLITLPGGRVTIHPDDAPLPASPTRVSAAAAANRSTSRSGSRGRGLSASPSRRSARGTSAAQRRREVPEPADAGDADPWVIVGAVSALARRLQGLKPSSLHNDPELAAGLQQLASAVGLFLYEQRRLSGGGGGDDDDDGWPQEPLPLQLLGPRAAAAAAAEYGVADGTDPYEEAEMVRSPSRLSRSMAAAPAATPPAAAPSPRSARGAGGGGAVSRSVSISARSAAGGAAAVADGGSARVAAVSRSVSGVSRAASAVSGGAGGGGGAASGMSRSVSVKLAAPPRTSMSRSPSRVVVRSPSAASSRSPYAPSAAAVAAAASPSRGQSAVPSPRGGDGGSSGGGDATARGHSAVSLASARGRHNERYGDGGGGGGSSRRSSGNGGGGEELYTAGAPLGGDGDSDNELLYMHCRQEDDEDDEAPAGSDWVRGGGSEQEGGAGADEDGGDEEVQEAPVALALKAAQAALAAARSEAGGSDRDEHDGDGEGQGGDGLDGGPLERAGTEEAGGLGGTGGEASAGALSSRAADADSVVDAGEVDEHEVYSGEYGGVYDDDDDVGEGGPLGGLGGGSSSKDL